MTLHDPEPEGSPLAPERDVMRNILTDQSESTIRLILRPEVMSVLARLDSILQKYR